MLLPFDHSMAKSSKIISFKSRENLGYPQPYQFLKQFQNYFGLAQTVQSGVNLGHWQQHYN